MQMNDAQFNAKVEEYVEELRNLFDWEGLVEDCKNNVDEDGFGCTWLGSCLSLAPSGKYYTAWANGNVTDEEAELDEAWYAALEKVADEHGMFYENGEDDATDLFVLMRVETEDDL